MDPQQVPQELNKIINLSLSFAGCGFLGIYHIGVGICFKKFASHLLLQNVVGASAGALVATLLLLDMPLDFVASEFFKIVSAARDHSLGPFSPAFDIQKTLVDRLKQYLPHDAHKTVSGRLHISLTRIHDGKNIVVSRFNNRNDLIDALSCAFFIPGFSGLMPPKFHKVRYMDGAFSDNLVVLNEDTVTVSPFCGETDISPKDGTAFKYFVNLSNTSMELSTRNVMRLLQSLLPPSPKELSDLCQQGYNDGLDFLLRNNLITCNMCSEIHLNFIVTKEPPIKFDPECRKCMKSRDESMHESMPEQVLSVFAKHVEGPNSLMMKVFNALAVPVLIPCSIANYFLIKVARATSSLYDYRRTMTENFHQILISALIELQKVGETSEELEEDEEDDDEDFSSENSSDDGYSEDCEQIFARRCGNL